jgi:RHS repeat-associated protein
VGGLLSMTVHQGTNAGTYFYCYDGNGNVAALVSAADGTVVARYEYGPFGELLRATGLLALLNPFRFSTKFCDDESGFYYYGYRCYDPSTGRWLSRDPIGEKDSNLLFAFVKNSPVSFYDMLGLWKLGGPLPSNFPHNTIVCGKDGKVELRMAYFGNLPSCIRSCTVEHEQSHKDDVLASNPNICVGARPGTQILYSSREEEVASERKACLVQLQCLQKALDDPKTTQRQKALIEKNMDDVRAYCNHRTGHNL